MKLSYSWILLFLIMFCHMWESCIYGFWCLGFWHAIFFNFLPHICLWLIVANFLWNWKIKLLVPYIMDFSFWFMSSLSLPWIMCKRSPGLSHKARWFSKIETQFSLLSSFGKSYHHLLHPCLQARCCPLETASFLGYKIWVSSISWKGNWGAGDSVSHPGCWLWPSRACSLLGPICQWFVRPKAQLQHLTWKINKPCKLQAMLWLHWSFFHATVSILMTDIVHVLSAISSTMFSSKD